MIPHDSQDFYFVVVDDSEVDFNILRRSFANEGLADRLRFYSEGQLLFRAMVEEGFDPALIMLDLNMPGTDGKDILRALRANRRTACVPVIILSTSNNVRDIKFCYENGASAYVRKPDSLEGYLQLARSIEAFWYNAAILPLWPKDAPMPMPDTSR